MGLFSWLGRRADGLPQSGEDSAQKATAEGRYEVKNLKEK